MRNNTIGILVFLISSFCFSQQDVVATGGDAKSARSIQRLVIKGSVPQESWADVFRCFVGPAARMDLKRLNLGIEFEMETRPDAQLNSEDPAVKAMREAARQLGLAVEERE